MVTKMRSQGDYYTYRIMWSADDKEYVGLCAEFPSLSWFGKTQASALQGIRDLVSEVISDMQANNENIPEPLAIKRYSGKLQVRIPPSVHRDLTIEAAEARVSINRLINAKLTAGNQLPITPELAPMIKASRAEYKAKGGRPWREVRKELDRSVARKQDKR